jgi:TolB-like protein
VDGKIERRLLQDAVNGGAGYDAQNPRYIETIPKRGYRLIAEVEFPEVQERPQPDFSPATSVGETTVVTSHWRSAAIVLAGLVVIAFAMIFLRTETPDRATKPASAVPVQSVAVLPFTDMSPEGDQGWFIDGVVEEILNKLAQVPGLKVTGTTSSFAFREQEAGVQAIGRTLGVAHLLEGSVRREGDRVRVTAQLLKAEYGFHVWSQEYDREVTEIFAIRDEMTSSIASALMLEMAVSEPAGGASLSFYPNYSAYELYLQARELIWQQTQSSLIGALAKLEKALQLEPGFAAAHVAMAEFYLHLTGFSDYYRDNPELERNALARLLVDKALAIDPNLAEAYVVQGQILEEPQAEASFRKAITLNPNLARVHTWLGIPRRTVNYGLGMNPCRTWKKRWRLNPCQ